MLHGAIRMVLCHFSRSPAVLRAMNLRFAAILPARLVCVLFYVSNALQQAVPSCYCQFFYVFACLLAVFTPFLRLSPFENQLSFDESAVYLTDNQYQNEGITVSRLLYSLLSSLHLYRSLLPPFCLPSAFVLPSFCLASETT